LWSVISSDFNGRWSFCLVHAQSLKPLFNNLNIGRLFDHRGSLFNHWGYFFDNWGRLFNHWGYFFDNWGSLLNHWGNLLDLWCSFFYLWGSFFNNWGSFFDCGLWSSDGLVLHFVSRFVFAIRSCFFALLQDGALVRGLGNDLDDGLLQGRVVDGLRLGRLDNESRLVRVGNLLALNDDRSRAGLGIEAGGGRVCRVVFGVQGVQGADCRNLLDQSFFD
jgi:hypothetical protein